MYSFDDLPYVKDVVKVLKSNQHPIKYRYQGILNLPTEDLSIIKINKINQIRDYAYKTSTIYFMQFVIPLGYYIRKLYPNRANFDVTLRREHLEEVADTQRLDSIVEIKKYKAVFLDNSPSYATTDYDAFTTEELNNKDILTITIQLIDRTSEPLNMLTTSGVYKNTTMEDMMHSVINSNLQNLKVDGEPAIHFFDMPTPSNTKVYKQILLDRKIPITQLPTHIQEKSVGLYTGDVGNFMQPFNTEPPYNDKVGYFVYPLFDSSRFTTAKRKLVIYNVPRSRLYGIERTFRIEGDVIYILATAEKSYTDSAETDLMSEGVGFNMTDASGIMKKPVNVSDNGPIASSSRLNYKVGIKDRDDGLNVASVASNSISVNPYPEYSKILQRSGARFDMIWQNAHPDFITPAMPSRYYYIEKGEIKYLDGVVLFNHVLIQSQAQGIETISYVCTATLTLFTN